MRKIVVGVDGSPSAEAALHWAVAEAEATGAPILAVTAWTFPAIAALPVPAPSYTEFRDQAHETMERARASVAGHAVELSSRVVEGSPAHVLSDATDPDDLLVVGARGVGGFEGLLLGSVSRAVLHRARSRTVVVHAGMTYERGGDDAPVVLVGVDASPNGRRALAAGVEEARRRHARCLAVHVCQVGFTASPDVSHLLWAVEEHGQSLLDDEMTRLGEGEDDGDERTERRVVVGNPAKTLIDLSEAADLLVLGTAGHGALAGLVLGSVSTACAERAACPVLVVPPD